MAVPVMRVGMGMVCGIAGAEVSGWIGMGEVWGAFGTGVAIGLGVACTGVAPVPSGCWTGGSGARSHPQMRAARDSTRTRFMITPADRSIISFRDSHTNNFYDARPIIRIDPPGV